MKILKIKDSNDVLLDLDMSKKERRQLLEYGLENCPLKDVDNFLINWAFVRLLKENISEQKRAAKINRLLRGVDVRT